MFGEFINKRNPQPYSGAGAMLTPEMVAMLPKVAIVEPQRFGDIVSARVQVDGGSGVILNASPTVRTLLVIQNIFTVPVWVNFGNAAAVGSGILLDPAAGSNAGGTIFFDMMVPQNQIYAQTSGGDGAITVMYCDKGF